MDHSSSLLRRRFKNNNSNSFDSNSSSFEDHSGELITTPNIKAFHELKLKKLESNFNQIAMAHHTDEQVIQACIDNYRDRFEKANNYVSLLFDEIDLLVNKTVSYINEEQGNGNNLSKIEFDEKNDSNSKDKSFSNRSNLNSSELNTSFLNYSLVKNKRHIQENLNNLNKAIKKLKQNFKSLVRISSTISGLKQVRLSLF